MALKDLSRLQSKRAVQHQIFLYPFLDMWMVIRETRNFSCIHSGVYQKDFNQEWILNVVPFVPFQLSNPATFQQNCWYVKISEVSKYQKDGNDGWSFRISWLALPCMNLRINQIIVKFLQDKRKYHRGRAKNISRYFCSSCQGHV